MPTARTMNASSQPFGLRGPPAASSAAPRADAVEFEAMRAVAEDVTERLAVGEDGREIEEAPRLRRGPPPLHQKARDDHCDGAEAGHNESGPPPPTIRDDLRRQEREADADRKARRVQRDRSRAIAGGQPVGQCLQSRHIGAGKSKPSEGPDCRTRPEALRQDAESCGRKPADDRAPEQHEPRIDAVGQRRQQRHGDYVSERITARHQAAFGGGEPPCRHQVLRQVCRQRHMRQQIADLADAHHRNQGATAQATNFVLPPGATLMVAGPHEGTEARRTRRPR